MPHPHSLQPPQPRRICWDRDTLVRLADFCKKRNILVISDEIHCDMAIFGHKHIPFASVSEAARENSITFQAPTKTFNMAGLISSYCIVPNEEIRTKFFRWLQANEMDEATLFAPIATIAAFENGEPWRRAMLAYIEDNVRFVEDYCRENIPASVPGVRRLHSSYGSTAAASTSPTPSSSTSSSTRPIWHSTTERCSERRKATASCD